MRIIAGEYRSRKINMPKDAGVRPTKDRIREALFNIMSPVIKDAVVLDLFAGSGAFGLEAISRGAERAVFVDVSAGCIETIKSNISALGIGSQKVDVVKGDAMRTLSGLERRGELFDIVLADPPYYEDMVKKCLIKLDAYAILTQNCIVVCEHHRNDALPEGLKNLTLFRTATYGDIDLSFYKRRVK